MTINLPHPRLLLFGFLMALASSAGQTFLISLYAPDLMQTFGLSHGSFGALYSGATLLSAVLLLYTGKLVDHHRLPVVTVMTMAGLCTGAALMAASGTLSHPLVLFGAFFLLRQCGQGLAGHIGSATISRYFDRARGRALSISPIGFAAGQALLPTLAVAARESLGWQASWLVAVAILAFAFTPVVLWLTWKYRELPGSETTISGTTTAGSSADYTRSQVLRDPAFYLMLPALTASPFIITGLFFHQVAIVHARGWPESLLAASYTATAAVGTAASLGAGVLIDRFTARRCARWFLLPLAAAGVTLAVARDPAFIWLYMGLAGLTTGCAAPLGSALYAEVYGVRHIGAIKSLSLAATVFATSAAPLLFGVLLDAGISATGLGFVAAGWTAAAIALSQAALTLYGRRTGAH